MPNHEVAGPWGVLGGAFDPAHKGHLDLAREALIARHLRGVLFVPAFRHPFKHGQTHAAYADRAAMLRLALAGCPEFRVEEIEAELDLTGFTVDTMRSLKIKYPSAELSFIIGADLLDQIARWRRPEELLSECRLIVGTRPGFAVDIPSGLPPDRIAVVTAETPDISSTELRHMIREGRPREELLRWLPEPVLDYLERGGLYR